MPPVLTADGISYGRRAGMIPGDLSFSRSYEENTRVVTVENLQLTLASDELYTEDARDPGKVFGRIGYQGAEVFTKVTQTVGHNHTTVTVVDSGNFSVGDIIHIGLETMKVTSKPNSTTLGVDRGVLGTFARVHRVDEAAGSFPYATTPMTYFRGRRVVVFEGKVSPDGSVSETFSDYIEVFRGFMATEPHTAVSGRSHQIDLEIAPLTAVLDKPLPTANIKTHLHRQLHAFDGQGANHFDLVSFTIDGGMYTSNSARLSNVGFDIYDALAGCIESRFDLDIADNHPRTFQLAEYRNVKGLCIAPGGVDTSGSTPEIDDWYPQAKADLISLYESDSNDYTGSSFGNTFPNFFPLRSARMAESRRIYMTTTGTRTSPDVKAWHRALISAFETYVTPSTINGVNGFYFNAEIEPSVGLIYVIPNFEHAEGPEAQAFLACANSGEAIINQVVENGFKLDDLGCSEVVGRSATSLAETGFVMDQEFRNYIVSLDGYSEDMLKRMSSAPSMVPKEALDLCVDGGYGAQVAEVKLSGGSQVEGASTLSVKVCESFYHMGNQFVEPGRFVEPTEKFIVLEGSFGIAAGSTMTVQAKDKDGVAAVLILSNETSITVDGFSGYRYTVEEVAKLRDINCLADMPGGERVEFTPTILPSGESIGELILKMLVSLDGKSVTSMKDVFGFGAGLSDGSQPDPFGQDIEPESFLSIQNPVSSQTFKPFYEEGDTLLKSIEGLLTSVGYTVDIRTTANGECRLHAVELALPNSSDVVRQFTTDEIAQDPTPTSEAELSIKNVFKFSSNFDVEGKPQVELTVRDQVSIDLFNETSDLKVELKGVMMTAATPGDALHQLRPMFSKLRVENSFPRRIFSFEVPTGLLHGLSLGDTCTVSHPLLRSQSGLGVSSEPARVRSIEFDGYAPTGRIELISYGVVGGSWNVSLGIKSIINGTNGRTLTVSSNDHSPLVRPSNGEAIEDLSGFLVGNPVDVYDIRSMDTPVLTTSVSSISLAGNSIQLADSVSGLLGSDTFGTNVIGFIQAVDYSNSKHTDYGYIGRTVST